jgi:hypothetical protein
MQAIAALKERLADPMREVQRLGQEIEQDADSFCDSNCVWTDHHPDCKLAQPEQEPVGMVKDLFTSTAWERLDVRGSTKVYLDIPPQRTEQEPVGALTLGGIIDTSDGLEYEGWDVEWDTKAIEALQEKLVTSDSVEVMLYTSPPAQPPQRTEQNFCPRCGKRTNDIHTCTPPKENT